MRRPSHLAFLSAVLTAVSFPRFDFFWLAWIAWVPLLFAIRKSETARGAFLLSYGCGFLFFLLSIPWLKEVTVFGLFFLCAYQALFFGAFGVLAWGAVRRFEKRPGPLLFALPAFWVSAEWLRSEMPVLAFGWNLLAHSQAGNLLCIQSAKLCGVFGVSFLLFLVNTAVFLLLGWREPFVRLGAALVGFVPFVLNVYFGGVEIRRLPQGPILSVSVIQGNIAQQLKWEPGLKELILEKYSKLTELASFDGPELVVWPEAAYPGFFNGESSASPVPELARRLQVPFLLGSPHLEREGVYFNSAYLLSADGEIADRYDKIRLVPFGEYVPFQPLFSFLTPYAYAQGVGDFSSGGRATVFETPLRGGGKARFGVLICFEDIFPELSRRLVRAGAEALFVMTNDAWFGHSGAPYQHLQASVFRAVENGVPVVRAANTGVSAFIGPDGEVEDRVRNELGSDIFVTGSITRPVRFVRVPTLYQKGGFLFPYLCVLAALATLLSVAKGRRSG